MKGIKLTNNKNQTQKETQYWTLTHNGRTVQITTEHSASSYEIPVVLLDGVLSDAVYSPECLPQPDPAIDKSITNGPLEHEAQIEGFDGATEMLVIQWATKTHIIMSLGMFGACGHISMPRS